MSKNLAAEADDFSLFDFSPGPFFLRLAYLLLALPTGVFYFAFLSAGISLGLGLAIIWIGIPILAIVMAAWLALADFERLLTSSMLGLEIPSVKRPAEAPAGLWETMKFRLGDSCTWRSLLYLLLKLPLGIVSFSLAFSAAVSSLALMAVPFVYEIVPIRIGFDYVSSWEEALLCALGGILLAGGTLVLVNGLTLLWRQAASSLLSRSDPKAEASPGPEDAPLMIR
ncbi:MAG: sensor domain-containing protein [Acidobacteriota bacterium]